MHLSLSPQKFLLVNLRLKKKKKTLTKSCAVKGEIDCINFILKGKMNDRETS